MSLLCQQRQREAIAHYREAEGIFVEMGDLANEMHAQRGLYECFWTINPDSAKAALDRFDLLKDSLYSNATAESLARYDAEFRSDWLHRENEQLRSRTTLYIIIGVALLLLIALAIWLWMHRRMHIREAALRATIAELRRGGQPDDDVLPVDDADTLSDADRDFLSQLVAIVKRDMEHGNVAVENIAGEMCLTRAQLNRRMKSIVGTTTHDYVMRIRMEQARLLLTSQNELSVAEVGFRCGFDNATSFSRAFRQIFGTSPSNYRAQH